jgi:lipoprotein-anchoring transpeptidase ErfK/SrfK
MAAVVAVALAVSGCTSSGNQVNSSSGTTTPAAASSGAPGSSAAAPTTSSAPAALATLSVAPAADAANVSPTTPIKISVANGHLTVAKVTNSEGIVVKGALGAGAASWTNSEPLGYGKTYTISASAVNGDGKPTTVSSKFTTVQPNNLTMPYFNTTGGGAMADGATYGVGMVVNVHFDEAIPDKAAAERSLTVKTTPSVVGSWYWQDDQNVHWRPQKYYPQGTKVTVTAKVYGVNVGDGLYGQADKSISFKIGVSHVLIADDNTKQVQVFQAGKLLKTMPTSMGMGGSRVVNGKTISFWTQPGIMTVLDKANPVLMDSQTYGLPHAAGGYKEYVYWATRITTDGVYLHSAPWSVWAQGNTDTSHGCLNLSPANAEWFYNWSQVGDVVQVKNTGGAPLEVWQNGDWGVPWAQWLKGSALHS